MSIQSKLLEVVESLQHSPVKNYVIPGLTSSLIGAPSPHGTVRLFTATREQFNHITPHSHRFDFTCIVLKGHVVNRLWTPRYGTESYLSSEIVYDGEIGKYKKGPGEVGDWGFVEHCYGEGDCYSMKHHQIHSIIFDKGTKVLFFEGPTLMDRSIVLEPVVDGMLIPTLEVKPWMFKKEDSDEHRP